MGSTFYITQAVQPGLLPLLQELQVDGFDAHPAATDAATHFGALFDTEPSPAAAVAARPGRPAQAPSARVPVALEAHSAQAARQGAGAGAELHAISDAASVSSVGTRRSSFSVCGGGGGGTVLAGWQARPLSRGTGSTAAASRAQATAADAKAMGAHLQQLASAAWVFETQWQATAACGHVRSPTPASRSNSRPTLVWNASSGDGDGSGGGSLALTQGALGACTAVLRLLQQQRARRLDLTVRSGGRAAHLGGPSACSSSSARAASSAAAAAAVLRTASAERHSAQCRLLIADGALGSLPAEVQIAEAEVCLAGTTAFVPRCHSPP